MKKLLTTIFILYSLVSWGQDIMPCGTMQEPPNELIISQQTVMALAQDPTIRTIGIVYHIVYDNDADSAMFAGGVNALRLIQQTDILTKCFRKQNADASQTVAAFQSVAADCHIEFCIKQVKYKKTTVTPFFSTNDQTNGLKKLPTGSPAVDPLKYLNIWVAKLNDGKSGVGGYAYYPTSGAVGEWFDGVASHITYVGSDDRRTGEVTVHEVGHYLYLPHTFDRDSSCTGNPLHLGDFCADTPPTDGPAGGCNLTRQACGHLTQNQNYMEYTDCSTLFTLDQSGRMTATLLGIRNQLVNSGICSGTPGNTPPNCSIAFPTNNQNFSPAPANINISVAASDPNGSVTKVEFFQGTTLLSTDQTSPYLFAWQGVTQGSYTLTARATDNANATTTSAVINITVGTSTAPVCNLVSPVNGANFVTPTGVRMEATATDADGIAKVEFAINNHWLAINLTFTPYVLIWQPSVGTFQIKARATDNTGAVTISQTATITVTGQTNPLPVVSITSPANGATYTAPASVTINATATDNVRVEKVEFYFGSTLWSTDSQSPYTTTRNNLAAGNYVLTARAYDSQNASTVSSPVSITVTTTITSIPVVKTTILPLTKQVEFEGNDIPPTKVRVKYQ